MSPRVPVLVALAGYLCAACNLVVSLDGLGGAAGAGDAGRGGSTPGAGGAGGAGAGGAGAGAGGGSTETVPLATAHAVLAATGMAQQTHLVYASTSAQWVLFYIDSDEPTELRTRLSPDFVTWSDGLALALPHPHADEGRNFSVAYKNIGSIDVVHIIFGHRIDGATRRHFHARATITGAEVEYSAPVEVSSLVGETYPSLDPDSPVTMIGADSVVTDLSGWTPAPPAGGGNANAWRSLSADVGTLWSGQWGPSAEIHVPSQFVNARAGVPLSTGEVLYLWENGVGEPNPSNINWSRWNGSWSAFAPAFTVDIGSDPNDWGVCHMSDNDVHLVRRTAPGDHYDHARYDGAAWGGGASIPSSEGKVGAGVVLLCVPEVRLFTIQAGASNEVIQTVWNGTGWGDWTAVVGAPATRSFLSGYRSAADGRAALIWTEASGGDFFIAGTDLSAGAR